MRSLTATLLAWLIAAPLPQFAQAPQAAPRPAQAPQRSAQQGPQTGSNSNGLKTFNLGGVTTQLVVEDVMVKSKDGNPVTGLTAGDFAITEDGKPQTDLCFRIPETGRRSRGPAGDSQDARAGTGPAGRNGNARTSRSEARYRQRNHSRKTRRHQVQGQTPDGHVLRHDLHADSGPDPRPDRRAEVHPDPDDAVRPDGHHDLLQRCQGGGGLHRRPRPACEGHQESDHRRGPGVRRGRQPTTAPPIPARPSSRTIPNSTSSTPTASCRRWRPP